MIQSMHMGEALDSGYWHTDTCEVEPLDPRLGRGDVILREVGDWMVVRADDDSVRIVCPDHWSEYGLALEDYLGMPTAFTGEGDPFRSDCSKDPHMNGIPAFEPEYREIPHEIADAFWQSVRLEREGFTRANWDRAVAEWKQACVWDQFPLERMG